MSARVDRLSDPGNTVATRLEKRRGLATQAKTDAEIRDLQRASGADALKRIVVNPKFKGKVIIQKQSDRALEIRNDQGITQFLIGTQQEVNGTATPFFLIGGNVSDIFTFGLKVFGFNGDILAPNGFLNTKTHSFARWSCGCHHVPGDTTLEVQGMPAWTQGGTIVNDDASDGSWARYTTAASIGSMMGPNGANRFRTDQEVEALFRIKMGPDISSQRLWLGLFESDPGTGSAPSLNFAAFRYSTSNGDTTWQAVTGDGANRTTVDTTIAVAANQSYYLRLRLTSSLAQFIVGLPGVNDGFTNGTWTSNITTTLPTATLRLAPWLRINALAASARSFLFGFANFLTR